MSSVISADASSSSSAANQNTSIRAMRSLANVRLWPAVVLVAAFWVFFVAVDYVEMAMGFRFLSRFGFYGIILLAFAIWWFAASRVSWRDRWQVILAVIIGAVVAGLLADKKSLGSMGVGGVFMAGFPFALTVSTLWMTGCKYVWPSTSPVAQRLGLCALIVATFGFFDLVHGMACTVIKSRHLPGGGSRPPKKSFWRRTRSLVTSRQSKRKT